MKKTIVETIYIDIVVHAVFERRSDEENAGWELMDMTPLGDVGTHYDTFEIEKMSGEAIED